MRAAPTTPRVLDLGLGAVDDTVTHRDRRIRLVVDGLRQCGDGPPRDELSNEDDATTDFTVVNATHVKAQIHFLEVPMERHGHAEEPSAQKEKTDDARKRLPVPGIELGTARNPGKEHRRI